MDDTSELSPFAAFAAPKRSPMEVFEERRRKAVQASRRMIGCVMSSMVGAAGGSTICAAFEGDIDIVLAAVAGSLAGTAIGIVIGIIVGAICFSIRSMSGARGKMNLDAELARNDPMTTMRALMFAWSLIGVVIGAAQGAKAGVWYGGGVVKLDPLGRWIMVGSILGAAFAIGVWFYSLRSMARGNPDATPSETA